MVQGKITDTDTDTPTIQLGATPSRLISGLPPSPPPIFTLDALLAATLPLYPGLGVGTDTNDGLHTKWHGKFHTYTGLQKSSHRSHYFYKPETLHYAKLTVSMAIKT